MKKEINPAIFIVVIVLVLVGAASVYFLAGRGTSGTDDLSKVDLRDEEPIRRGQPGYRERTTDPPQ